MQRRWISLNALALALVLVGTGCAPKATELAGLVGSGDARTVAIDDRGVIVGNVADAAGQHHPFRLTPGGPMVRLPEPPTTPMHAPGAWAVAANNEGVVVGATADQVVRWNADDTITMLGTLRGLGTGVTAINDAGVIIGKVTDDGGAVFPWVYDPANGAIAPLPLPVAPGLPYAVPLSINNAGVIVGFSTGPDGSSVERAVVWRPDGHGSWSAPTELPGNPGASRANDINNAGVIVGQGCETVYCARALQWKSVTAAATDLPVAGRSDYSMALAVNDAGQVIGDRRPVPAPATGSPEQAYRWTPGATAPDLLDVPGAAHIEASAINRTGVVVGSASAFNQPNRAIRWP